MDPLLSRNLFVATKDMSETMLNIKPDDLSIIPASRSFSPYQGASIKIKGDLEGEIYVFVDQDGLKHAIREMLESEMESLTEEDQQDCVGELTNLIIGNTKNLMEKEKKKFEIGTPQKIDITAFENLSDLPSCHISCPQINFFFMQSLS